MMHRDRLLLHVYLILLVQNVNEVYSSLTDYLPCSHIESSYNVEKCNFHWNCTIKKLLKTYTDIGFINRNDLTGEGVQVSNFMNTPLLLRVVKGKLHCVQHPRVREVKDKLTIKAYRALHYINRVNRILRKNSTAIPAGTEWWTHQGDAVKFPLTRNPFPLFGYSGANGYADIAGIPFMSFSDKMGMREEEAFRKMEKIPWEKRADTAFFLGSLSDCSEAKEKHSGDLNFCTRAKIVYEAAHSNLSVLQDIGTISSFKDYGFVDCPRCQKDRLTSQEFVKKLYSHKYLLNMPGVGQSRRMSQLLRSGGVIFQAENKGYQFYDFDLKPGSHYITFDPQFGVPGAGNLVSRINFAKDNNFALQNIAARAKSYSENCLTESSIDVFVTSVLESYSRLLVGKPLNFPIVDLSSCISKSKKISISRLCPKVIRKCWFRR